MLTKQNAVIVVVMIMLVLILLFPPMATEISGVHFFYGWHFIADMPMHNSTGGHDPNGLDFTMFLAEYLIIITVGGLAYWLTTKK